MAKKRKRSPISPRKAEPTPAPASAPLDAPPRDYAAVSASLLMVTAICFVLGRAINNEFVTGDDVYLRSNPIVQKGLTEASIARAFTTFDNGLWQPVTWLSFMLDQQMFQLHRAYTHLTNVLLHAVSAVLLFLALKSMTGELGRSLCVAVLFAVHPLRVEAVAWAAQRGQILAILFGMATLLAYSAYVRQPRLGRYVLVVALFALSLLAGPMLATLPLVLLLLDWWPLGRLTDRLAARRLIVEKLPLLVLSLCAVVMAWRAQGPDGPPMEVHGAEALLAYNTYIGKTLMPIHLAPVYPPLSTEAGWSVAGAAVLLAGLSYLLIVRGRAYPYLAVGWLWFLITLLPFVGLLPGTPHGLADRWTYFPQVGLLLLATWGVADLAERRHIAGTAAIAATALAVAAMVLSWIQIGYWHDSETLWRHTLEITGKNAVVESNLARALLGRGDKQNAEARQRLETAVEMDPNNARLRRDLAILCTLMNDPKGAIVQYREAAKLEPDNLVVHFDLASLYINEKNLPGAEHELAEVVRLSPRNPLAAFNLGRVQAQLGKWSEARTSLEQAVKLQPGSAAAHQYLAFTLGKLGDTAAATKEYQESTKLDPFWPQNFGRIAWQMATHPDEKQRSAERALELAQMADSATEHRDPQLLDTLAAAYAESKRFDDARKTARKALALATEAKNLAMQHEIEEHLQLYLKDQPYRQPPPAPPKDKEPEKLPEKTEKTP